MKKFALVLTIALLTAVVPTMYAQNLNHGEIGAFVDLTRLHHANDSNFWGLGGRVGFNVHSNVQFEAEMGYDFERAYTTSTSRTIGTVTTVGTQRTSLRLIDGLFGPKFQTGGGPVRAFFTLKGGFLNFSVSNSGATSGFTSGINQLTTGDTNG